MLIGTENGLSVEHNSRFIFGLEKVINENVKGDFFDIGCWRGTKSFLAADYFLKNNITDRSIYLFDTFEGHVGVSDKDQEWGFIHKLDEFKVVSTDDIKHTFELLGFSNYHIIKGDIRETLPKHLNVKVAFCVTDLNLYEPTKYTLDFLKNSMVNGSLLHEDDYNNITGITQCFDENRDIKRTIIQNELFFYF